MMTTVIKSELKWAMVREFLGSAKRIMPKIHRQMMPKTRYGTVINRKDIPAYRDMIVSVEEKVQQMIAQGKSPREVLAAKITAPYDAYVPGGLMPLPAGLGTSADRFVGEVYAELKASK